MGWRGGFLLWGLRGRRVKELAEPPSGGFKGIVERLHGEAKPEAALLASAAVFDFNQHPAMKESRDGIVDEHVRTASELHADDALADLCVPEKGPQDFTKLDDRLLWLPRLCRRER